MMMMMAHGCGSNHNNLPSSEILLEVKLDFDIEMKHQQKTKSTFFFV